MNNWIVPVKITKGTEHEDCILHVQFWATTLSSNTEISPGWVTARTNFFRVCEELPAKAEALCKKAKGDCMRNALTRQWRLVLLTGNTWGLMLNETIKLIQYRVNWSETLKRTMSLPLMLMKRKARRETETLCQQRR